MRILADPNIPRLQETFSGLGEIRLKAGREWCREDVMQAEVLLVRSVTRVDRQLLDGSPVGFIGSATAGLDHIDRDYLAQQGIQFSHAPGSNADSVVEYVISALFALLEESDERLSDKTVGIIGVGQVGSRLAQRLRVLGVSCLLNDPPREAAGDAESFVGLDEVLRADIISLHVPLSKAGKFQTRDLLNAARLDQLLPGTILINTARGGVLDEAALLKRLERQGDIRAVIDCWENEPDISPELLARAVIATPHIAGYSYDGKLRATRVLYQALCEHLERPLQPGRAEPEAGPCLSLQTAGNDSSLLISQAVFGCYDVRQDSQAMKRLLDRDVADYPVVFDDLRKNYPIRREFCTTTITMQSVCDTASGLLEELGFLIEK